MFKKQYIEDESGIALVIALVMLLALTVLGLSSLTTSNLDIQISSNERRGAEALNIADAGAERGLLDVLYDYKRSGAWSDAEFYRYSTGTEIMNTLDAVFGEFSTSEPDGQWGNPFAVANVAGSDTGNALDIYGGPQEVGDGDYYRVVMMRDSSEPDEVYVRSYAEISTGARKILQLHLKINMVDAWRNAIFAGRGSATALINGNIKVAGPIHLLGTGAENPWTLKGNAGMVNGYQYLDAAIRDRIVYDADGDGVWDNVTVVGTYAGQPVYSLESVFRNKNMQIVVDGSAELGEAGTIDSDGDGTLDLILADGVYYKAYIDSILSNTEIDLADPYKNAHADEIIMPDGYDLGDKIQMPAFNDPYDPAIYKNRLGQSCSEAGFTCDTYEDYITQMSTEVDGSTFSTACTLEPGTTADFQYGTFDASGNCIDANGCIKWIQNPGVDGDGNPLPNLVIDGTVELLGCPGGVTIAPAKQGDVVYAGKGLIYTEANMFLGDSVLNYAKNTFLKDDLIGFLTKKSIGLAETPWAVYMGGFYAASSIGTDKSGSIIGALVANLFCMGTGLNSDGTCSTGPGNAADIYYTPGISETLKGLGMIMGNLVYSFDSYEYAEKY